MTHHLPIIITTFLFVFAVILTGYFKLKKNDEKHIIAAVSKYVFGATHLTPCKTDLKGKIKKTNAVFVHAIEDGPLWQESDLLVVDKSANNLKKETYYVLRFNEEQYRIAKCIDNSDIISPVFDGGETLFAHELIGEVIGVWNISLNKYNWFK